MCCIISTNNLPGNHKLSVDWRKPCGYFCCNFIPCLPTVSFLGDTFGWQYVDDGEGLIAGSEPGPGLFGCLVFLFFAPFWIGANACGCFNHTGYYFYMEPNSDRNGYEIACKVSWKSGCCGTSEILKGVTRVNVEHTSRVYEVQNVDENGQPTGGSHTSEVKQTWMTIEHRGGTWRSRRYEDHYSDFDEISFQAMQLIEKAKIKPYIATSNRNNKGGWRAVVISENEPGLKTGPQDCLMTGDILGPLPKSYLQSPNKKLFFGIDDKANLRIYSSLNFKANDVYLPLANYERPVKDGSYVICMTNTENMWLTKSLKTGEILWRTEKHGSSPHKLFLEDSGELKLTDAEGKLTWSSAGALIWSDIEVKDHLNAGEFLPETTHLQTAGGEAFAKININIGSDGRDRFTTFKGMFFNRDDLTVWRAPLTSRGGPYRIHLREDGDLVQLDVNNKVVWSTNTAGQGVPPHKLVLEPTAELKLFDANKEVIWSSSGTVNKTNEEKTNK